MARGSQARTRFDSVHERTKGLDWDPTYFQPAYRRETKYRIPKRTKDPFRHLLRTYSAIEEEKDARMYGSISDVINRLGGSANADARWVEGLKFILPILTQLEIGAQKGANVCVDSLENPELRCGYMAQVLDEVRHAN